MKFIRIEAKEDPYYDDAMNIYINSFPIFERRTEKDQIDVLKNEKYKCNVVCDNNKVIGILFYWEINSYRYIEHFAIDKNLRGKSYGSKILKEFCEENKTTILEIDMPVDDISIKRLNFYSNLGFKIQEFEHIHPLYRKKYDGHRLKVMSFDKNLSKVEYDEFCIFLKSVVMEYSEFND